MQAVVIANHAKHQPVDEWSVFWQSDQLQSCMPVYDADACEALYSVWQGFFSSLADGAKILDLGTGNGSVAAQAVAVSKTKKQAFSIHGVDLSAIAPHDYVASANEVLGGVRFYPHMSMEELPFSDNYFDAVVSQYAIEYSEIERSIDEALRVLRSGGKFRFLLHTDEAVLKQRCGKQRLQAEAILGSDLFMRLNNLLQSIHTTQTDNTQSALSQAKDAIAAFTVELDSLESKFLHAEDRSLIGNVFSAVRGLPGFRNSHDLSAQLAMANDVSRLLGAQAKRLQAMENAALNASQIRQLLKQLECAGTHELVLEAAIAGSQNTTVGNWLSGSLPN